MKARRWLWSLCTVFFAMDLFDFNWLEHCMHFYERFPTYGVNGIYQGIK
ncbi:MAG: hypothetical protein ACLTJG_17515 [[Clostridium] innocuum]